MFKNFATNKLKIQKKQLSAAIALALMLTIAATLMTCVPVAFGQKITTLAYSFETPNPIGLRQKCWLVGWISPPTVVSGDRYANLTLTVTKPDRTTESFFYAYSNVEEAVNTNYVCDQLGTYSVKLSWEGDATHEAAVSPPYYWTVQQEEIPTYPSTPLPTGYWQFPISAEDYEWYQISGPWAMNRYDYAQANFNPYSKGPNTGHVLWRTAVVPGGLIGGSQGYASTQGVWSNTNPVNDGLTNYVAANGRLYYTTRDYTNNGTQCLILLHCVDQNTGEVIYEKDLDWPNTAPVFANTFVPGPSTSETYAEAQPPGRPTLILELTGQVKGGNASRAAAVTGAYSLWVVGNGLREIDPWTGATLWNWTTVNPTAYADNYFYISSGGNLTKWSTRTHTAVWSIRGLGSPTYIWNDMLVYTTKSVLGYIMTTIYDANTGALIANGTLANTYGSTLNQCVADGKVFYSCDDLRMRAVSLYTAQLVWTSEPMQYPYGAFQAYTQSAAYGMVYSGMLDGYLYAFNTTNGKTVWKHYSGNSTETAYGTYPWWGNIVIADGKVYAATGEHTPPNPMPRGYSLCCLNAYTGDLIWKYPSFTTWTFQSVGFGDGISAGMLWYQNMEDGCLYMFGKGQSETTVTAPMTTIPLGDSVLIQGTVTDQSPGEPGTPAIADASMSDWMQYLYNNAPAPTNATGVPVSLRAMRSDGTVIDITHVTSDIMGHYEYTWTPPAQDTYKILATFEGSESYWSSSGQTGLSVGAALPTPAAPQAAPDNTPLYILGATVAIIIAIAIVGMLILRKRP